MMQIVVAFVHITMLAAFSFWLWKRESPSLKIYFWPALILKLVAGISLGLLYRYYYFDGDTFQYFEGGTRLAALAHEDLKTYFAFLWSGNESFEIWATISLREPRALFMIKIVSLFSLITLHNYWITSFYFSVASFFGAWLLVKQIVVLSQNYKQAAVVSFLFFPSVVFWSAGVIKESLAMACLCFLCSLFVKTWIKDRLPLIEWIFLMLTVWLLWNLKYYYLAVFLPIALTSLIFKFFVLDILKTKKVSYRTIVWLLVLVVLVVAISLTRPNFYPERFLHVIVSNYEAYVQQSEPNDLIQYTDLQPTVLRVLMNSPLALFSGLFRPFIWESHTVFQSLVAMENACVFLLTLVALFRARTVFQSPHRLLVFSIVIYTTMLCIFLALSTPNFGTLARYKVGFMPFFLLVILIDSPILFRIFSFYEKRKNNKTSE